MLTGDFVGLGWVGLGAIASVYRSIRVIEGIGMQSVALVMIDSILCMAIIQ